MVYPWIKTLPRDARFFYRFGKAITLSSKLRRENRNVGQVFDTLANRIPEKPCFYFNDDIWTYKQVQEESNRIGNYFSQQGFVKGDIVSVFMSNRIEVVTTWLGLSKIGVVSALVNFNLISNVLKYSIEIVKPKAIICGYELSQGFGEAYPHGESKVPVFGSGVGDRGILFKAIDIDPGLRAMGTHTPIPKSQINFDDDLFYIYTSGTTGLPKAAIVKQSRFLMISNGLFPLLGFNKSDVIYSSFPLQHTAAGILVCGFALQNGIPAVIRSKFTATEFWKDCIKHKVTAAQYIGEICRYLLRQPVTLEETQHSLRRMFGNGLKPELWHQFQERFKIPMITEMYGSTEGNCNMFNICGEEGAVGFVPVLLQKYWPINIIKLDKDEEPIRDPKTNFIIRAKAGETGELVGKIVEGNPIREYKGYVADESSSKKRILRDVFKKGDAVFRSGDLFVCDEYGYYYFKDRIGDTFRFKGENVSTTEVEGVINKITALHDVVVYGVKIPEVDGTVGMAAIADPDNKLDLALLAHGILKELPNYSRPRFLRIVNKIEDTVTHKLKKVDLQKDGYDLNKIGKDKIYLFREKQFQSLTPELVQQINSGDFIL